MRTVIVPDYISSEINQRLDEAMKDCPGAEQERDALYHQLLAYFDETGRIPSFHLTKKETA